MPLPYSACIHELYVKPQFFFTIAHIRAECNLENTKKTCARAAFVV